MRLFEAIMLVLVGMIAGTMNSVVGSGGLVTFPALLAFGYPPLVANMTNNMGVLPGALSAAFAYRRELKTQWSRIVRLAALSLVGGFGGAILLLVLPAAAFKRIVPILIALALVLIILQPRIQRRIALRKTVHRRHIIMRDTAIFLTGTYGGYFGAAQGILLISILGAMFDETIQKLNSIKIMLAVSANSAAAVVFIFRGGVAWQAAGAIAIGSTMGGQIGAHIGRRLPTPIYRGFIVLVGLTAIAKLVLT